MFQPNIKLSDNSAIRCCKLSDLISTLEAPNSKKNEIPFKIYLISDFLNLGIFKQFYFHFFYLFNL